MNETIWFVGMCVICILALAIAIPVIVGSVQFWVSVVTDLKHFRDRRRDKKPDVQ